MSVVVRGLSWDHPRGHPPMLAAGAAWSARHPEVRLTWTARSLADFAGGSLEAYVGTHDLVAIDHPTIGEAAARDWIVPLDTVLPADVVGALTEGSVDAAARPYVLEGRAYAAPLDAAALCAAYRADLLPTPPTTVAELVELGLETGRVAVPLSPFSTIALFSSLCVQLGAEPFGGAGVVDREVGRAALHTMADLVRVVPEWCFEAGAVQLMDRLTGSDELLYVGYAYGYSTYGRAGRARPATFSSAPPLLAGTPTRPTLGGVGLALLRDAPYPGPAAAHLAWVAAQDCQTSTFVRAGGQPAHAAAWSDDGLDAMTNGFFRATGPSLRHAYVRPTAAWFGEVQPELGRRLRDALRRGRDVDDLLDELDVMVSWARTVRA